MDNSSPIQKWIEDNNIVDIRFYPKNPDQASVSDLLDSAHSAVTAFQEGKGTPYSDSIESQECLAVG